ncbi:MAG: hypothetical protein R3C42_05550 [Parvularculaceae bacterium]
MRAECLADTPAEWMRSFLGNLMRQKMWMDEPVLNDWLGAALVPFGKKAIGGRPRRAFDEAGRKADSRSLAPAAMNLQKLIMSGGVAV